MTKTDRAGTTRSACRSTPYTGSGAITGTNRNEVEGIRVGGANGANDNYFSDFGSFARDCRQSRRQFGRDACLRPAR